jgi:hypothetical protein
MTSFFRKIRQKLLSQNRITQYLAYAISEIFLVVIGILIALQVNNWNESRKARMVEIKFYEELKKDLEFNLAEIDEIRERLIGNVEGLDSMVWYLDNHDMEGIRFDSIIIQISRTGIFNNANSTYQYMRNEGFSFISNDFLQAEITKIYEQGMYNIGFRNDFHQDLIRQLELELDKNFASRSTVVNPQQLKVSHYFRNLLKNNRRYVDLRLNVSANTQDQLRILIGKINEEIKELK